MKTIHVLLAEDNDADVFLVHCALRQHELDYTLDLISDGDAAARHLDELAGSAAGVTCPDVFILDLNLPGASGHELLRQFRMHCAETPVIVFTSSEAPMDIERSREAGASRYFRKPSDLDSFLKIGAVVKELVEQRITRPL